MVVNIETEINGLKKQTELDTPFIKAVLELIRATYENDSIVEIINPTNNSNLEELSDFFEYILKYPAGVDIPKVIVKNASDTEIVENADFLVSDCDVVCFSGGIDSTAALLHLLEHKKNIVALWCDYGQPYNEPEREAVVRICKMLSVQLYIATVDLSELIALGTERFKHVFPARNLLIAAIAAALQPNEIVLAGLSDELVVPDKSPRMYSEGSRLLNYRVYSPFINMTKAEVLSVWKKRWNKMLDASETVSCYGDNGDCQNCSSCAKREVAKIASEYSDEFPQVFITQNDLISGHWFSRIDSFDIPRRAEILISLNKFYDKISPELQAKTKNYLNKYNEEVISWKSHLNNLNILVEDVSGETNV